MKRLVVQTMFAVVMLTSIAYAQTNTNGTGPKVINPFDEDYMKNSTMANTAISQPSTIPGNTTAVKIKYISGFNLTQQNAITVKGGEASGTPEVAQNDTAEVNKAINQENTTAQGTSEDDFETKYKMLISK
jgi:hypothetical protein